MRRLPYLILFILMACNKNSDSPAEILMSKGWHRYEVQAMSVVYDDNTLLYDTTYATQACEEKAIFHFLPDGIVNVDPGCVTFSLPGTWKLMGDSLTANVWIDVPASSGYLRRDYALGSVRLVQINKNFFEVSYQTTSYGSSGIGPLIKTKDTHITRFRAK